MATSAGPATDNERSALQALRARLALQEGRQWHPSDALQSESRDDRTGELPSCPSLPFASGADSLSRLTSMQSLCHCLKEELRKYDSLIASLETRRAATACSQERPGPGLEMHEETHLELELDLHRRDLGLTLARIVVWTQEPKLRMRMMGVLIEGCASERGNSLKLWKRAEQRN